MNIKEMNMEKRFKDEKDSQKRKYALLMENYRRTIHKISQRDREEVSLELSPF